MAADYLMAGQQSELERLQLQSRVWEPAGQTLLARLPSGSGLRVLDVGCGAMGWLRVLSAWVGPTGTVVGTDINRDLLAAARAFAAAEELPNVELVEDDLFASALPAGSFDLVHARFQLAPIGHAAEQLASYRRLVRPDGWLVLEDPDAASWHFNPPAPAAERLISLILGAFRAGGGDFDAGRSLRDQFVDLGIEPTLDAHVLVLPPGHPYLRLPLQFAASLTPRTRARHRPGRPGIAPGRGRRGAGRSCALGHDVHPHPGLRPSARLSEREDAVGLFAGTTR
jgi:SAM-dependent methyltransferase